MWNGVMQGEEYVELTQIQMAYKPTMLQGEVYLRMLLRAHVKITRGSAHRPGNQRLLTIPSKVGTSSNGIITLYNTYDIGCTVCSEVSGRPLSVNLDPAIPRVTCPF